MLNFTMELNISCYQLKIDCYRYKVLCVSLERTRKQKSMVNTQKIERNASITVKKAIKSQWKRAREKQRSERNYKNSQKTISNMEITHVLFAQLCPTLCGPMDCSPPGSSVHGIL